MSTSINKLMIASTLALLGSFVPAVRVLAQDAHPSDAPIIAPQSEGLATGDVWQEYSAEPVAASATTGPVNLANFVLPMAGEEPLDAPDYEVGAQFNKGVFIRSTDLEERPYSLYIGGRLQLRYVNFSRDELQWTDNAGVTRQIRNRNYFDTERARINFSGNAISPDLTYAFIVDGDGDDAGNADFLAYTFTYKFCEALSLRMGRDKPSSTREWLLSSRYMTFADRSLATEFFRPTYSDGIWLLGRPTETLYYEFSITNGLATSRRRTLDLDNHFAIGNTLAWQPLAEYGDGFTDFQNHQCAAVQLGSCVIYEQSRGRPDAGFPLGDDDFLRLEDGTSIASLGALAPGVQLVGDTMYLASYDLGYKYRGFSLSSEYFMRWLQDFAATGPLPHNQLYTYGFRADAGYFWIPKRLDTNVRMSQVSGFYGNAFEYAVGGNWYWGGEDDLINKFTVDVANIIGSPVTSSGADYVAGDDGILVRAQVQVGF